MLVNDGDVSVRQQQRLGIFDAARATGFVGRREILDAFVKHLGVASGQVLLLTGVHGAGKTETGRKMRDIALDSGALVFCCDGRYDRPLDVIGGVGRQLSTHFPDRKEVRSFRAQLESYRRDREQRSSRRQVDRGSPPVSMAVDLPGPFGVARTQVGGARIQVGKETLDWLGRCWLNRKWRDVDAADSPDVYWSERMAKLIQNLSGGGRVVWLVDDFERLRPAMRYWLLDMLALRCADDASRWVAVVAGSFDPHAVAAGLRLEPTAIRLPAFTPDEVEEFLRNRCIDDRALIAKIQRDGDSLPLHLHLISSGYKTLGIEPLDVSGRAADLILQTVEGPARKRLVLDVATAGKITENTVAVIVGDDAASSTYSWLKTQCFVEQPTAEVPYMHFQPSIRNALNRYHRQVCPERPHELHVEFAYCYTTVVETRHYLEGAKWDDPSMREVDECRAFHVVAGASGDAYTAAVNEVLTAYFRGDRQHGHRIASEVSRALIDRRDEGRAESILKLREAIELEDADQFGSMVTTLEDLALGSMARSEFCWLKFVLGGRTEERLLDEALEHDQHNAHALSARALHLLQEGDADAALETICEAIRWRTWDNPELFFARAQVHAAKGNKEASCNDLIGAVEMACWRHDIPFITAVGSVLRNELDEPAKAVEVLTRALTMDDGDDAYLRAERGATYFAMEDYDLAARDLEAAVELNPEDSWAQTFLAEVYASMGDVGRALVVLDEVIRTDPVSGFPYATRARLLAENHKYDAAIADLDEAIRCREALDESDGIAAWLLQERGLLRYAQGDFEAAVEDFSTALAVNWHPGVLHLRGAALHELGDLGGAAADFAEAIRLEPASCGNHVHKALVLVEMGEWQEARECFRHAAEHEPAGLPLVCLALVEAWLGEVSALEARLEGLGSLDLSDILVTGVLAFGLLAQGDEERAVEVAGRALEDAEPLDPEGSDLHQFGHCLARFVLGDTGGAGEILRSLAEEGSWVVDVVRVAELFEPLRRLLDTDPAEV